MYIDVPVNERIIGYLSGILVIKVCGDTTN